MQINYKRIYLKDYNTTYVISDIHACINIFKKFINHIEFKKNDLLIINGDIFEKGPSSLELIRYIISLSQNINIEIVLGNNDTIFNEWGPYYDNKDILRYLDHVQNSILIDIANELEINYSSLDEINTLYHKIHSNYQDIINFLKDRPHILESEEYIFVHAGIENKAYDKQTYEYLLTAKEFANKVNHFNKTIIVGHWPTSNYSKNIININPYFNNNIISIDGGISLKKWAQLNYLIIDNNTIKYDYIDDLAKVRLLSNQKENQNYYSLIFPKTICEILHDLNDSYIIKLPVINKEIIINKELIYKYRDNYYVADFTNYHAKIIKGDVVSFVEKLNNEIMIKKDGIISLYNGKYEYI